MAKIALTIARARAPAQRISTAHPSRPLSGVSVLGLALAGLGPIPAQPPTEVLLTNHAGCEARITANGIAEIRVGAETFGFEDLPPLLIRTTVLDGGQVLQSDYWGEEVATRQKDLTQSSPSQCRVAWRGCTLRGVTGTFDLVYSYEVLAGRPAIAVRGALQNSSLEVGIQAIAYRQYLAQDGTPDTVSGGFTGAVHLSFASLPLEKWNLGHPLLVTGGYQRLGSSRVEEFLATRTSETLLIAATHYVRRRSGMLLTRDARFDPDNVGREIGIFGSNAIGGDLLGRFGAGALSYLPNDNRPGNGGVNLDVGAGLVYDFFIQENATEPYWDAARAYRSLYVDPLLAEVDKVAVRPQWAEHCLFMAMNVADETQVFPDPAILFLDEFLRRYDQVTDVALLLWGATEPQGFAALPGLDTLMIKLRGLETALQKRIHASLYYVPTSFIADVNGGGRLGHVCRDPFGNSLRFPLSSSKDVYLVNTADPGAAGYFKNWVIDTLLGNGAEGVYFDDAIRNRFPYASHYAPGASLQGRVPEMVGGCLALMAEQTIAKQTGYVITELGVLGRSVPGNVIQGVGNLELAGAYFKDPQEELQVLPFLNDVAGGKHYLCGYAGALLHSWLQLDDLANALYYPAQVVRGLLPLVAPWSISGRQQDLFQLCNNGIINLGDPRVRTLGVYSDFMNASMGFFVRHADVLARWRREPFPGTHDIPKRVLKFSMSDPPFAYQATVDEIPFGCFSSPDQPRRVAVALANPHELPRQVGLRFARNLYGLQMNGQYRLVLEAQDGRRSVLSQGTSGDLVATLQMPAREFALVTMEPGR